MLTDTHRKPLRALVPGDRLLAVEAKKLKGPRGGRYTFRGLWIDGGATFERTTINGEERTFYFTDHAPFRVSSKLSCLLVAQVDGPEEDE